MDLSIIIVSWKVKEKLIENLKSLFENRTDCSFEVFVVDNNSGDGTVARVAKEFPQVKLINNDKNLGFAKANNQAIKLSCGEFILLLNPDMQVFPDTIDNIVCFMRRNEKADVAGCKLIDNNGEVMRGNVRRFPAIFDQLAIVLKIVYCFPDIVNKYLYKEFDYNKEAMVDSVRGGFFAIRRSVFDKILSKKIISSGEFLDERYFIWFEEVDFCRSVKECGGQVWYTPSVSCVDFVGQSFKQITRLKAQRYFRESQLKYFKKWHPCWQYLLLLISWPFGLLITIIFGRLGFESKKNT